MKIRCPECNVEYDVAVETIGQIVECQCGKQFRAELERVVQRRNPLNEFVKRGTNVGDSSTKANDTINQSDIGNSSTKNEGYVCEKTAAEGSSDSVALNADTLSQPVAKANLSTRLQTHNRRPFAQSKTPFHVSGHMLLVSGLVLLVLALAVAVIILVNRLNNAGNKAIPAENVSQEPNQALDTQPSSPPFEQARIDGVVEGGAWVIRKGGQSDLLRGLTVYVMNVDVDCFRIKATLRDLRDEYSTKESNSISTIRDYSNPYRTNGVDMRSYVPKYQARYDTAKTYGKILDNILAVESSVDLKTLYGLARTIMGDPSQIDDIVYIFIDVKYDKHWNPILKAGMLKMGQTGIDGKFRIPDVAPGEYFLYAKSYSELYFIEWLLPITVTSGQSTKIDLFNDNAILTLNKE
jgi:hypothetical protein